MAEDTLNESSNTVKKGIQDYWNSGVDTAKNTGSAFLLETTDLTPEQKQLILSNPNNVQEFLNQFGGAKDNTRSMTQSPFAKFDGDIISSYDWTPTSSTIRGIIGIPYIELNEYELNGSYAVAGAKYWIIQLANSIIGNNGTNDPYFGLYSGTPTGSTFKFPYYESYHHLISNNWAPRGSILAEKMGGQFENLLEWIFSTPKLGIDMTEEWVDSGKGSYNFSFFLFNTLQTDINAQQQTIHKNRRLIERLIYASLPSKTSAITIVPPCLYTVKIPGIRYSPAAVIQSINVENVGHTNLQDDTIIPDAWKVTIMIHELIRESRQIYENAASEMFTNNKVKIQAIISDDALGKAFDIAKTKINTAAHTALINSIIENPVNSIIENPVSSTVIEA
jgi:hypothetical protein